MSILSKILRETKENFEIIVCGLLFLLLLLRNPFSLRTQIANFAPAPDAFYYIVPARSLVEGKGPYMVREGMVFSPIVPPLYSLVLAPIFIIRDDPRMFYFVNVGLAIVAFVLFTALLGKLFPKKRLLRFALLFLFASNHIIYWFPTLAMAENLILPLFLANLLLLFSKSSPAKVMGIGALAVALYVAKYVCFPLTGIFILLYLLKLRHEYGFTRQFWRLAMMVILSAQVVLLCFGLYGKLVLKQNDYFDPVNRVLDVLNLKAPASQQMPAMATIVPEKTVQWFSISHAPQNFPFYLAAATGKSMQVLWEWTPLMLGVTAILGWAGLAFAFFGKRHFEAFSLFLLIVSQIFLLLVFLTPDGRYVVHIIPCLLLGVGMFFGWVEERKKMISSCLLVGFLIYVLLASIVRVKKDIMLNLKYTESPWWYIAVLELNKTIDRELPKISQQNKKRPFVITPLYPYLVDFFSSGQYSLLPMSPKQEFRSYKEHVWGNFDYNHLETEYLRLISLGHPLYIASYGIGHEEILLDSFDYLQKAFRLEEISSECHNLCKVYRVWPTGKSLNLKGQK